MPPAVEMLDPTRGLVPLTSANPAVADVSPGDLVFDGRPIDATIVDPEEVGLERRLDGASNLTIQLRDPAKETAPGSGMFRPELLNSGIFARAVDLDLEVRNLDGVREVVERLAFRLADRNVVDIGGVIGLDILFEATAVARLRTKKGAKHASRKDKTRAEFIKSLCDEAGVPFVCPDLRKKQRIQTPEEAMTPAQRKAERARDANLTGRGGSAKGKTSEVTVKGVKATREQLQNIQTCVRIADSLKAPAKAEMALFMAIIVESTARNLPYGDRDSKGILQLRVGLHGEANATSVERSATLFLRDGFTGAGGAIAIARKNPGMTAGQVAQAVQGSAYPTRYDEVRDEAVKMMQAFGASGSLDPLANTDTDEPEPYAVSYQFKRLGREEAPDNRDEDSWTCMRRLAEEVNWRLWEEAGSIYFMTDDRILKSSVEMTIEPFTDGVISANFRTSNRRERQEATIECEARLWDAGIATVVEVYGYGKPDDGRWIVSNIRRPSLWEPRTTITLQRREAALLEPAHELRQRERTAEEMIKGDSRDLPSSGLSADGLPSPLSLRGRIVEIAKASMTTRTGHNRYSQPGALTADPTPPAPARTDCSQWIRACYLKAGGPDPGVNTWEMARKGTRTNNPLPGDIMLTASVGHCELYVGDQGVSGQNTIGHGSAPIDPSHTRNFPGHFFVTFPALNPNRPGGVAGVIGTGPPRGGGVIGGIG